MAKRVLIVTRNYGAKCRDCNYPFEQGEEAWKTLGGGISNTRCSSKSQTTTTRYYCLLCGKRRGL